MAKHSEKLCWAAVFCMITVEISLCLFALGREHGRDFLLRYNQATMVRQGTSPATVFLAPPQETEVPRDSSKDVTVDSPWTYTMFIPFSLLPYKTALLIFSCIQLVAIMGIIAWGYYFAYDIFRQQATALFIAFEMCLMIYIQTDLHVGNLGLICAAALCGMLFALECGKDWLAGVFGFILILKPQAGVLFFIPLLMDKKYRTILCAGVLCVLFSLVSSLLVHQFPWEILHDTYIGGKRFISEPALAGFLGILHPLIPLDKILSMEMVTGFMVVAVMSYRLRKAGHWFIRLLPALVLSTMWTYSRIYHLNVIALLLWATCVIFFESETVKQRIISGIMWLCVLWPLFNFAPAWCYALKHLCLLVVMFYIINRYQSGQFKLYDIKEIQQ